MGLEGAIKTFFEESSENLSNSESFLLNLRDDSSDETLNALFREIHTIKGSSGMFGFTYVSEFTHNFENMLDELRKNLIQISDDFISVSLEANDFIRELLLLFEENQGAELDGSIFERGDAITDKINTLRGIEKKDFSDNFEDDKLDKSKSSSENNELVNNDEIIQNKYWHISIRFDKTIYQNGLDPFSFIKYLKKISEIKSVTVVDDALPEINEYIPINCYMGFEIDVDGSDLTKEKIEDVFEFAKEDSIITILPPFSTIYDFRNMISHVDESSEKIGEILLASGTITKSELEYALKSQHDDINKTGEKKLGEVLVENKTVHKAVIDEALNKQAETKHHVEKTNRSMRIDANKIDELITLVGELVISSANVRENSERNGDSDLIESTALMLRLVDEIRDHTMNIRMVPIGEVFSKFRRIVYDLSRKMDKKIELEIKGGDTELDKTLIEKISDPLLHIIRNAIDHGIETSEERRASGKSEIATVNLNAYYESGTVVIEISDDGKGLNREKIFGKAVEQGLISENENISDSALWQLLFEPGFSTAETVTDVSGRGVGMDVVKKNIDSMRGAIDIETRQGKGTTFRIHLPLTLAIIDGFLVRSAGLPFVIPLDMVYECTDIDLQEKREGGNFFNLRDSVLPYLELNKLFKYETTIDKKRDDVIIVEYLGKRAGLVVDKLEGELQTVIKPLGKIFNNLKWISGATIMGNGDVALILDIPRLIKYVQENN